MTAISERPWYREAWLWFVIALPASAVIAGVSTVVIANMDKDSLVVDDFQKVGLVARRETAREVAAETLGIVATTSIDRQSGQVTVRLQGEVAPATLHLGLFHPTRSDMDRGTLLKRDSAGLYRGNIGSNIKGHWYLQVSDTRGQWRITGRLEDGESLATIGHAG